MTAQDLIQLLRELIAVPSFSREEGDTAGILFNFLSTHGARPQRIGNNVYAVHPGNREGRPVLLLNSHHDTVMPNSAYTRDPFDPVIEDGKLFGLGSNDAGGPLVCLIGAFLNLLDKEIHGYNLVLAATAEEEISGKNGIESILPILPPIDMAIVGEPTLLHAAVAEKGLLVLDGLAMGKPGHAAREEGENAIYNALNDIEWFRTYSFPKVSPWLGPVKMSVTMVNAGSQHNVVPDRCEYVVDVRTTDKYTLEETLSVIRQHVKGEITPRSVRLRPSGLPEGHPLMKVIDALKLEKYGSPTLSDQALLTCPSLKIGPGDSARSHSADEFIYLKEIEEGLALYGRILDKLSDHV